MIRSHVRAALAAVTLHAWLPSAAAANDSFDLREVQVAQAIQLVQGESLKRAYVLAPEILQDRRTVSFRFDGSKGPLLPFWAAFLDSLGYEIEVIAGADFLRAKPTRVATDDRREPPELLIYRPKYRQVSYLAELLRPLLPSDAGLSVNREIHVPAEARSSKPAPTGTAAELLDRNADVLLYEGPASTVARLRSALSTLDQPESEVLVKGVIYEVTTSSKEASALSLIGSLLSGRVNLELGRRAEGGTSIGLSVGGLDAVLSALSGDSRFKVVSTPQLRVKSGATARLVAGQEVPVLGSVSYPQGGSTPVRAVEYRSSGVIFEISPRVRERVIEVSVLQQLSDFARTATGVNDSPTLTKREASTTAVVRSGETVVIGGLSKHHSELGEERPGLLPFLKSWHGSNQQTELILLVEVTVLTRPGGPLPL